MSDLMRKIHFYENLLESKKSTKTPLELKDVKNWQICRCCLTDIDGDAEADLGRMCIMAMDGGLLNLREMILKTTEQKISLADQLPMKICRECLHKISTWYFFKIQAQRAESVLIRLKSSIDPCEGGESREEVEEAGKDDTITMECVEDDHSKTDELSQKSIKTPTPLSLEQQDSSNEEAYESEVLNSLLQIDPKSDGTITEEYVLEDIETLEVEGSCASDDDAETIFLNLESTEDFEVSSTVQPDAMEATESVATDAPKRTGGSDPEALLLDSLTCSICDIEFTIQRSLVDHVQKMHPKIKAFRCRDCGRMFAHTQSLSRHRRSHQTRVTKNVCDNCGKSFMRSDDLKRHMRVHTGERPYGCVVCRKAFKQSNELREHQLSHLKSYHFQCNQCGQHFSSRNGIYLHKKAKHCEKPPKTTSPSKRDLGKRRRDETPPDKEAIK